LTPLAALMGMALLSSRPFQHDVGAWDTDPDGVFRPRAPLTSSNLMCEPSEIHPGDTLTMTFTAPHGGDAGIVRPDGEFLWIADTWVGDGPPPAPQEGRVDFQFKRVMKIAVPVADWKGQLDGDRPKWTHVFRLPGVYLFEVARILDADEPIIDAYCKVRFDPRPRPKLRPRLKG